MTNSITISTGDRAVQETQPGRQLYHGIFPRSHPRFTAGYLFILD